ISLVFFPAPISDITLSQSTFLPAVAHAFGGLKPTVATTISDKIAKPNASFRITIIAPEDTPLKRNSTRHR
ncbi:MAG: hypothetical protein HY269_02725, partial [Deltaproteobacteria bacterium]|nr:hypothetical protein [Deltaproteobacteria bacterium]